MEQTVAQLGKKRDEASQLLRLKLAEAKMAHLASLLLLWHCGRTGDIQRLFVNWDLRQIKKADGRMQAAEHQPTCLIDGEPLVP